MANEAQKKEEESELDLEEMKGRMSRVEDLEAEVAAVRANLLQAKEQLVSKEFDLVSKES